MAYFQRVMAQTWKGVYFRNYVWREGQNDVRND
jgi:hypothetical protein